MAKWITTTGVRAAVHEVRCAECRVTWKSWVQRIFGIKAGFAPHVRAAHRDVPARYRRSIMADQHADYERLASRCHNRAVQLRVDAERLRQVVFSLDQAADQWEAEADVWQANAARTDSDVSAG